MPTRAPVISSIDLLVASRGPQAFLAHDAFDILHDHDGVVDEKADRQHEREQRQRVDGEAGGGQHAECAQQHHRHGDRRDQRRAPFLQEQEHYHDDKHDRLDQGLDHLLDREPDEARIVDGKGKLEAGREILREFGGRRLDGSAVVSALAPGASLMAMPEAGWPFMRQTTE